MCGILGYISVSGKRVDVENFKQALDLCSERGTDATGIYTPATGTVKKDLPADKFIKTYSAEIEKAVNESNVLLAHCRATTKGTERNNENNHPHESDNYVVVHNGIISRTNKLHDYKYKGECDSEIISSYLETYGVKKGLEEMYDDSMSIAIWDKKKKKLYLYKNTNPACLLVDKKDEIIYFASTSDMVKPFYRYSKKLGLEMWDEISVFETFKNKLMEFTLEKGFVNSEEIKHKSYVYNYSNRTREEYTHRNSCYTGYEGHDDAREMCLNCREFVHKSSHVCRKKSNSSTLTPTKEICYRNGVVRYLSTME